MVGDGDGLHGPAHPLRLPSVDRRTRRTGLRLRPGPGRHLSPLGDLLRLPGLALRSGRPSVHRAEENLLRPTILDSKPKPRTKPEESKICEFPFLKFFITARKRSLRRLCFYTCLSVILFTVLGRVGRASPGGSMHVQRRGHACLGGMCGRGGVCHAHPAGLTLRDMINERAVRIPLECILVFG